jgi:hypothetical protein
MGFARRVVRKSVRRATPRSVRRAMHPARTVKNAVTPRPVKQVSRAAYTVRHPVGAAENKVIGAALYPPRTGRRKKRGFWWSWLTGQTASPPPIGTRQPTVPQRTTAPTRRQPPAQPWPARQAFRTPPPPRAKPAQQPRISGTSSAGQWELDARRQTGLGDGSRNQ